MEFDMEEKGEKRVVIFLSDFFFFLEENEQKI